MSEDKGIRIQVCSACDGHNIQVLTSEGNQVLFSKGWNHNDAEQGAGGELNFIELLNFLGYEVYHEESY